jgi:hypothetical protein
VRRTTSSWRVRLQHVLPIRPQLSQQRIRLGTTSGSLLRRRADVRNRIVQNVILSVQQLA